MKLNYEQMKTVSDMEKKSYIDSVIKELESKKQITLKEINTLESRLSDALTYAKSVNITHSGMLHSFLYLEALRPGFSSHPVIRKAIEESTDREQRYKDIINTAVNLMKRR